MTSSDWLEVVASLEELYLGPSKKQLQLARQIQLALDPKLPSTVCATHLMEALADELRLSAGKKPATEGQLEYLKQLASEVQLKVPSTAHTATEIDSWITAAHARRAANALKFLKPVLGDIVEIQAAGGSYMGEVASISADGRLNFKGGRGLRARPHLAKRVIRPTDNDYSSALSRALENVAQRNRNPEILREIDRKHLQAYSVELGIPDSSYEAVREALELAEDEKPMQKVLEQFPEVLAHLITSNRGQYVIPQKRLGSQYIPDFAVAGETSAGIQWTLVELESPRARIRIKDGSESKELRHAIKQISDWRDWLDEGNTDYARRPPTSQGLGLAGITSKAVGLIIIGRGEISEEEDLLRRRILFEKSIAVRTYDWLLREIRLSRAMAWGSLYSELASEDFTIGGPLNTSW